jgi:hypothetical protein
VKRGRQHRQQKSEKEEEKVKRGRQHRQG